MLSKSSPFKILFFALCVLCVLCGDIFPQWDKYPTYDEYLSIMSKFETDYPSLCKIEEFGTSVQNRKLLAAKVSDNVAEDEAEPGVLFISTIHGDELAGYVLALHLIDSLLTGYATSDRIKNLVDNIEIWICPLANPDGTYRGGDSTVSGATAYNANNIDLCRDFPGVFISIDMNSLRNLIQPETQALIDLGDTYPFVMTAGMHSGAELICYPWGISSKPTADEQWFEYVCTQYAEGAQANSPSGYFIGQGDGVVNGYNWYELHGDRMNYVLYYQNCRSVKIELSSQKLLSESDLINYWNYNYNSFFNYMEQVLYGIRGTVTDTTLGIPIDKVKIFVNNHDKDSSFVRSHLPHGDYYRPIYAGTYDVTFSCDGWHPKTFKNVQVENNRATIINVELSDIPHNINSKVNSISDISIGIYKNVILINSNFPLNNDMNIEIYNLMGRKVKTMPASEKTYWKEGSGIYLVRLVGKGFDKQFKVMVTK